MNLFLVCTLLLLTICFATKDRVQIAFMPSAGNFEVIPSFVKMAEFLSIFKGYGCVAVVHGADKDAWDKTPCVQTRYGTDEGDNYMEKLFTAHNRFEDNYFSKGESFREPYEAIITDFVESKVLFDLKRLEIDVLVCDVSNLLCNFVAQKLDIIKKVYYTPTLPSYYLIDHLESTASYHPVMTSPYTNLMSLRERFMNYLRHYILKHSIKSQRKLFAEIIQKKGGDKISLDKFFDPISLVASQSSLGFNYPLYLPPNVAQLGCISCIMPHQLPLILEKFINKFKTNIFIKIDRINTPDILKNVIDSIGEFNKIGFLVRADFPKGLKLPGNLYKMDYIPTVDILASGKISGFIHDGDWSSIIESVYYEVPMIVLSYEYDRRANGAFVNDRKIGVSIRNADDVTKGNLFRAIKKIVDSRSNFMDSIQRYSRIIVGLNTTKQIEKWFQGYIDNGIEHLVVKPYYEMPFYEYYNMDVWFVVLGLPFLLISGVCFGCFRMLKRVLKKLQSLKQSKKQTFPKERELPKEKIE